MAELTEQGLRRVLLIEPDGERARLWARQIEKLAGGYAVEVVASRSNALRRLSESCYSVTIVSSRDWGSGTLEVLREIRARGHRLPVLAVLGPDQNVEPDGTLDTVEYIVPEESGCCTVPLAAANLLLKQRLEEETSQLRYEVTRIRQELDACGKTQAKDTLRGRLLDRVISDQEREKKSLAEDIHDESLQALATCLYKVDLACRLSELNEPERVLAELHGLRARLAESIDRLGNLIFDLRPPTLDTLGLLPTLDAALHKLEEETGAKTLLQSAIGQRLSSALETTIYRLVQGALDNVRKHARASAVLVGLKRVDDMVRVVVEDNGVGFSPEQPSGDALQMGCIGLAAMRERVELAGGSFEIDSNLGDGTRLIFALPFQGRDQEPEPPKGVP